MRKLLSVAGATLLALATIATPAHAQATANGSCGPSAGNYGMTDVNSGQVNQSGETVPGLFYQVNYSGVPAPTTVGVIIRYNGELESQTAVQSFVANAATGIFLGGITANISPDAQGFANSIDQGYRGRGDGGPSGGGKGSGVSGTSGVSAKGLQQNSPTQGGLLPGEYVFYVYTGSTGDVVNVKDGTVARNAFIADEKGFLGRFSCGVSTEAGTGPG